MEAGSESASCGKEVASDVLEQESALRGPQFSPPIYQQRYEAVLSACRRLGAEKVVDIGCAECKLLRLLVKETSVRELVGVDIQEPLLQAHSHRLQPLITDYVLPRQTPLTVTLMQGSIAVADQRLMNFDLLSCVEVIEHLDPPVLARVPAAIFGELQPKVVLMTTPNAEFNVLFPNFHGFRHHDHRFEWTRSQFQRWCEGVCAEYPYTVEFSGVGLPPPESNHVGCCSQMATFTRTGDFQCDGKYGTPYNTVMECKHPHRQPLSLTERLCREAEYWLLQLVRWREGERGEGEGEGEEEESDVVRIKLDQLLKYKQISELCSSVEDIKEALHGSAVVREVEGGEAVFHLSEWRTDSSCDSEESDFTTSNEAEPGMGECGLGECGLGECTPENWD